MIAIVKYNAGNIRSVKNALDRIGVESKLTDDPEELRAADKVIFPGVGHAKPAMDELKKLGLIDVLLNLHQPFLGICLGMQLMCGHSEEGDTDCLGIFPESVKRFTQAERVPHMGWNSLQNHQGPLFEGIPEGSDVYFVHSYYVEDGHDTSAVTSYGERFAAALQKGNYYGVQFHPEKSGPIGQKILENFLKLPS